MNTNATVNDFLGKIKIYNAKSTFFDMSAPKYTVTVNWTQQGDNTSMGYNQTQLNVTADFDPESKMTVFGGVGMYDLGLWNISSIQFAEAA
jgi:hypothetical protein